MGKKKCKHAPIVRLDRVTDRVYHVGVCIFCDEAIPLGPSRDAGTDDIGGAQVMSYTGRRGMEGDLYLIDDGTQCRIEPGSSPPDTWEWDPSRSVAGQYEERLVEVEVVSRPEPEHGVEVPIEQEHTCITAGRFAAGPQLDCAACDVMDDQDRDQFRRQEVQP